MRIESVMPSNHLILHHPFLLLPWIFPSIRVFSESVLCIRWPKYWSFSFSISLSNEYSVLISFRIDWLDLLAEPSPTPQFKSINPSTLSFLCGPVLTSIHDYWKSRDIWSNRHFKLGLGVQNEAGQRNSPHSQQTSPKCSIWMQSQKWQNISVRFQGKPSVSQ